MEKWVLSVLEDSKTEQPGKLCNCEIGKVKTQAPDPDLYWQWATSLELSVGLRLGFVSASPVSLEAV